jgi:hypothetical protein
MKGDFSRLTFDQQKRFTRVLMQQGRVQLDADWNEQAAILLYYLERLAADLIGPFGGPEDAWGLAIGRLPDTGAITDLTIGAGRYYVDGRLCENPATNVHYFGQPSLLLDPEIDPLPRVPFLVYLDVWERHVSSIEDGSLREVALGGPDTATRAQMVWQVRVSNQVPVAGAKFPETPAGVEKLWPDWVDAWQPANRGRLQARAKPSGDPTDPCLASPDARFRGLANQLYRVEIHTGGKAGEVQTDGKVGEGATFKWSRENGSVAFAIADLATDSGQQATTVTLEHLGHEGRAALETDDWVEIADDDVSLEQQAGILLQVGTVDADRRQVTLRGIPGSSVGTHPAKHPLLRRWDHGRSKDARPAKDGALAIAEGRNLWMDLEDGVQVSFQPAPATSPAGRAHVYRRGDYWLIPARTATGDVEWPQTKDAPPVPQALEPYGVPHSYAPLALVVDGPSIEDLRTSFKHL